VAYWKLEESGAPWSDATGNGHNLMLQSGAVTSIGGKVGNGLNNASNTTSMLADSHTDFNFIRTQGFSIEVWAKTNNNDNNWKILFGRRGAVGASVIRAGHWQEGMGFSVRTSTGQSQEIWFGWDEGEWPINDGQWHHWVFFLNETHMGMWLDGQQVKNTPHGLNSGDFSCNSPFYILRETNEINRWFGDVDEFAVYRGQISEAEILDHYNNGDGKPYDEPSGPTPSPNYNWHYEYDGLSRLVSACSDWEAGTSACLGDSFAYSYDGAGNLLSFSRWSGTGVESVNFVYNGANQIECLDGNGDGACGDAQDIVYTYDPYGNLISDGSKVYAYDAANRLVSVSDGVSTTIYTYNGHGDRMSKTVEGVTTSYVIDTAMPLTMVLAETTGTETVYYLHGLDLVAQHDGITTEYFAYDGLGSVRQVVDDMGQVLLAKSIDPYGNPYVHAGEGSTSWGFTGEQTDENGLLFLRARYYQPSQGRFLQRDPWRGNDHQPLSINPWLYVHDSPINRTDPSGYIAQGQDAKDAVDLIGRLKGLYNVIIKKDWGEIWTYDFGSNPRMKCGWEEGNWRSLRELELVEEAIKLISPDIMTISQFHGAFNRVNITRASVLPDPAAPPSPWSYVLGDIVLPDSLMDNIIEADDIIKREAYVKRTVIHEFGHVWDYRTNNELSKGMMMALGTWVWSGDTGNVWDPFSNAEIYPGTPIICIHPDTGPNYFQKDCMPYGATYGAFPLLTGPGAEDWANSLAAYVYPDGFRLWDETALVSGGVREAYVRTKIQNLR
jgi:RHS repeat-associated protein